MGLFLPRKIHCELFVGSSRGVNIFRFLATSEQESPKNVCNIMDLDVNRDIYKSHLGGGIMDQCVRWTLEKNILVPSESLFSNVSVYSETYGDPLSSRSCSYRSKLKGGNLKTSHFIFGIYLLFHYSLIIFIIATLTNMKVLFLRFPKWTETYL